MQLHPVESSLLLRHGYNEEAQVLVVQFKDSPQYLYAYIGVDPLLYDQMLEAESMGSFFISNVKGKRGQPAIHEYRRIDLNGAELPASSEIEDERIASAIGDGSPAAMTHEAAIERKQPAPEVIPPKKLKHTIPELPKNDYELKLRALDVVRAAEAIQITNKEEYSEVDGYLLAIKTEGKMVLARLDEPVRKAREAYESVRRLRDETLVPYTQAEEFCKRKMLDYVAEEKRIRREAEEAERRRLQKIEDENAARQAQEDAEHEARTLEAQGEIEAAQSVRANPLPVAPVTVAPVVLESQVPKGKSSVRENWQYRIFNAALIPLTHEFYTLDEKKIAAKAKMLKGHANIPGVEVYDAGTISARTK